MPPDQIAEVLPDAMAILGESTETFAEKVGLTRMTLYKYTSRRTKMDKLHANAITNVVTTLAAENPEAWPFIVYLYSDDSQGKHVRETKRLIKNVVDESVKKIGRCARVRKRQKAVLAALNARSNDIWALWFSQNVQVV